MNNTARIAIVVVLVVAVGVVVGVKRFTSSPDSGELPAKYKLEQLTGHGLPVLIDVGAGKCIPCKMMAPILEELEESFEGRVDVHVLDLSEYPGLKAEYGISMIPTQIFYDGSGKELYRHVGFFSKEEIVGKWKELSVEPAGPAVEVPAFERLVPAKQDERAKEGVCYMCDGDIAGENLVVVETGKGPVRLCSPHCYFIMYSCLTEDKTGFEENVSVADRATGRLVKATEAVFLYGQNEATGRPWIKAFGQRDQALKERSGSGGSILALEALRERELSSRCGFCDRACYPHDAAEVIVAGGIRTLGCCSHCALGVAARTGRDIEVHEKDRLTGEEIVVKTLEGKLASLEPQSAVAWFGQRKKADGTWGSAGCFHQGFFVNSENLKRWVERNPYETGRLISISQALGNKMKLSPEQIKKACKIGECVPR